MDTDVPVADLATGPLTRARTNLEIIERLTDLNPATVLTGPDRDLLAKWSGWGPMARAFDQRPSIEASWKELGEQIAMFLPPEAVDAARAATTTAYYTPRHVMAAMWRIAVAGGISDGAQVLEPGCGSGRFLAAAPIHVDAVGIEIDPTTARIAALLHPHATIINKPLQEVALRDRSLDLVIGNVPFADVTPYDKMHRDHGLALHNYFLWRGLMALRPGGLLVAVTSRFTLDANGAARRELNRFGEFVGAVRLPRGAMAEAGTDVIADIVVMRRRAVDLDEHDPGGDAWLDTVSFGGWNGPAVNRYFVDHPRQVVGQLEVGRGQYRDNDLTVTGPDGDVAVACDHAATEVAAHLAGLPPISAGHHHGGPVVELVAGDGRKLGSYHYEGDNGTIVQIIPNDDNGFAVAEPVKANKELQRLIVLRNAVLDLLEAEANPDLPDESVTLRLHRTVLNKVYDDYVAKHGPVNRCTITERGPDPETGVMRYTRRRPAMGGFRKDPDYVAVLSIEEYDDDTATARKGPIFTRRVNRPVRAVESVATAGEAVAVSLDRLGHIDLAVVAGLLAVPADQVPDALQGHAFLDPVTQRWVPADEYLSGNVRVKLDAARFAVAADPRTYHDNVARLGQVQPVDLLPHDISVRLGAPWVPLEVVRQFVIELLAVHERSADWVEVSRDAYTATWAVKGHGLGGSKWSTRRVDAERLIELALNNDTPVVYDTVWSNGRDRKVRNRDETLLACEKQAAIQAEFGRWIWADPQRSLELAEMYNLRYNSTVLRRYQGGHLSFPGMVDGFDPYPHQKDMVARALGEPAAACGHPVGAGKTAIMAMTAAKLRETGMTTKPVAIVPNHLLEQVAREVKALFPTARLLMAGSDEVSKDSRKLFAAKVATGDWDLVVMTHSAFTAIPVGPDVERDYIDEKIFRYRDALGGIQTAGGRYSHSAADRTVKQIEKAIDKLKQRSRELLDKRVDDGVTWDQLGVTYLMVDEAHLFKNLGYASRSRSGPASKRAEDLAMKLWQMRRISPGARTAMLLSGTLVSNTLAEMFVMQTYLQPDRLEDLGIAHFDAWAGMFVENETKIEVAPDGGSFRMHTRPSKFRNVPELRRLFAEVADIRTRDQLGLGGPLVDHHTIVVAPSDELTWFVDDLVRRADLVRGGNVDPTEDNMLKVCTDGRKAALDLALVGVHTTDPGKTEAAVERIHRSWVQHRDRRYTGPDGRPAATTGNLQVVFCDMGTPNSDSTQVYGKIRAGLIARGMPAEAIRFVHDAKTDNAKATLFNECRNGKVAVLLGSTDKLGLGTNIQHRMTDLHHVDAPWRPADVEQREGRGLRPGNQNDVLSVHRYVTERSFDSYMWQGLERKARFIAQVLTGDPTLREVDDIDSSTTLSFAEVKALATGNPLVMEHAEAQAMVTKLRKVREGHASMLRDLEWRAGKIRRSGERQTALAVEYDRLAGALDDTGWQTHRTGTGYLTDPGEIGMAAGQAIRAGFGSDEATRRLGFLAGVEVVAWVRRMSFDAKAATVFARLPGSDDLELFDVDVKWLRDGQWWRLGDKLLSTFQPAVAAAKAVAARDRAEVAARDERRLLGERGPFPQEAELVAAEARLAEVESIMSAEAEALPA